MSKPDWVPPLPELPYQMFAKSDVEILIREYAETYRKAWVGSLRPSFHVRTIDGEVDWGEDCFGEDADDLIGGYDDDDDAGTIPLYRLDRVRA